MRFFLLFLVFSLNGHLVVGNDLMHRWSNSLIFYYCLLWLFKQSLLKNSRYTLICSRSAQSAPPDNVSVGVGVDSAVAGVDSCFTGDDSPTVQDLN